MFESMGIMQMYKGKNMQYDIKMAPTGRTYGISYCLQKNMYTYLESQIY